jgi:creatinine amidohydrolase/Fe(II)-dependent formamide hydrolase-like protein
MIAKSPRLRRFFIQGAVALLAACCATVMAAESASASVFLDDLTSPELRSRVASGTTTVLIPIGGTEQSGPHMALGKHNVRVKVLAGLIATRLGNAVVAPVLAYVPEGAISPPAAHMRFIGTISIPDAAFEAVLEAAASSLRQHGFQNIFFLGDHGGYQKNELRVAQKLNKAWSADNRTRAYGLTAYYESAQAPFTHELRAHGLSDAEIGLHAGVADTALMLATDPSLVRMNLLAQGAQVGLAGGVNGDPRRASAESGTKGVQLIVDKSVQAITEAVRQRGIH